MAILTQNTQPALWLQIVHDAEALCAISLHEELEAYLVFLLARYINQPNFAHQRMAIKFLQGMQLSPRMRADALQGVGDECLLLAGLYPHAAQHRLVRISYFVQLGRSAYRVISDRNNRIFAHLDMEFVALMDVLQSIRQPDAGIDLLPLEAIELWQDTGSKRALRVLRRYTCALPVCEQNSPPGRS